MERQQSFHKKQMKKQLTGKRDDTALHSAARAGNLEVILKIINEKGEEEEEEEALNELLSKQNQSGETALYVAAECGHVDLVEELVKYYDVGYAAIKAKNGFDAFHIAAKLGELGQYVDDPKNIRPDFNLGEANIAPNIEFTIFLISDSLALFISLAVVVVQTSLVVVERQAKKRLMAVINKLMWLACTFVSVAFLALCYIIVGKREKWLAVGVTFIGTLIMATTLGTLCYWVVMHRIEASNLRSLRRSARNSRSQSWSVSVVSDSDIPDDDYKKLYAL